MEQATSSISVSQQCRPTRNVDSNRTKRLVSKACFRPVENRAHMLRIAHFDPEFAFRFNVSSFSCSVSLDRGRLPSHGLEWRVFSTLSCTLRPCSRSSAQYCLMDVARLMIVASSFTCQYVQSAGSVGTLIQCVIDNTAPSPLMHIS